MAKRKRKPLDRQELESLSPFEALRIDRTRHNRDEFVVLCGFVRGTYYRWITGQTEARLTIKQLKKMAQILGIERIEDLPDDFAPPGRHADENKD